MFVPKPIASEGFILSGQALAEVSSAETELMRAEARIAASNMSTALRNNIARLEAIATIRIEDEDSSFSSLLRLECLYEMARNETGGARPSVKQFLDSQSDYDPATADALKYLEVLKLISSTVDNTFVFTPRTILDLHSLCMTGERAEQSGVRFRERPHIDRGGSPYASLYQPPSPEGIPTLIDDLCAFMNKNVYSPTTQAALAHFQFEGIKPFKHGLDRSGRAMCHTIMFRRGLFQSFIVPIALMPAIDTYAHASSLLPYISGKNIRGKARICSLNNWVRFCAHSTDVAASIIHAFIDVFGSLLAHWQKQIGRTSRGSALEELLPVLMGNPVITVAHAAHLLDRSISTTNEALNRLTQCGVVRCEEQLNARNRIFVADDVPKALDEMKRIVIKESPVAREEAALEAMSKTSSTCARCGLCNYP